MPHPNCHLAVTNNSIVEYSLLKSRNDHAFLLVVPDNIVSKSNSCPCIEWSTKGQSVVVVVNVNVLNNGVIDPTRITEGLNAAALALHSLLIGNIAALNELVIAAEVETMPIPSAVVVDPKIEVFVRTRIGTLSDSRPWPSRDFDINETNVIPRRNIVGAYTET